MLNLKSESEGFVRQNLKFMKLYRECLTYLHAEVREKKKVLDASQLAFLTADPGVIQQTAANHLTMYQRVKKQPEVPSQMDSSAIWSKYTSEAVKVKADDLQARIKQVE